MHVTITIDFNAVSKLVPINFVSIKMGRREISVKKCARKHWTHTLYQCTYCVQLQGGGGEKVGGRGPIWSQ